MNGPGNGSVLFIEHSKVLTGGQVSCLNMARLAVDDGPARELLAAPGWVFVGREAYRGTMEHAIKWNPNRQIRWCFTRLWGSMSTITRCNVFWGREAWGLCTGPRIPSCNVLLR